MATNKTIETSNSVTDFINTVEDETKRDDCKAVIKLMQKISGCQPKLWGPSIVGFGTQHYKYDSGREGDMPVIAFSPRKNAIVFYLSSQFPQRETLLKKFGKHTTSKACIYVKKLAEVDMEVLKEMITRSFNYRENNKKA